MKTAYDNIKEKLETREESLQLLESICRRIKDGNGKLTNIEIRTIELAAKTILKKA